MPSLRLSTGANYLHIPARQYGRRVYRVVKKERFLSLLATRKNVLVKPELWDDPFENFILKSHFVQNGELVTINHRDHYYGQCWTLQQASDAMWRIYSPDSTGIRIRSTIRKLAESLADWRGEWAAQEVYVGKVRYLNTTRLLAFGRSVLGCHNGPLTHKTFAETLLVKRPAFSHEREIRLLFTPHDFHNFKDGIIHYPVEPNDFVDQVMLDPRLDEAAAAILKKEITDAGFQGAIKRSLLYAPPPDLLVPLRPSS
jgi:hypothetical protein